MMNIDHTERFKKAIDLGAFTLKVAILINGGAAIALLAFFGNLPTKLMVPDIIISINLAIRSFGIGVLAGAIAATASFFSEFYEFDKNWIRAKICFAFATLSGISSLVLFWCGLWEFTEAWIIFIT